MMQVLRFEAYMKEEVPEAPSEGFRIRQFSIFYFLVDDSIRVSEVLTWRIWSPWGVP